LDCLAVCTAATGSVGSSRSVALGAQWWWCAMDGTLPIHARCSIHLRCRRTWIPTTMRTTSLVTSHHARTSHARSAGLVRCCATRKAWRSASAWMCALALQWSVVDHHAWVSAKTMAEAGQNAAESTNDNYNPNIEAGPDLNALAKAKLWDGKRAEGECSLFADGEACRRALLEQGRKEGDESNAYQAQAGTAAGGRGSSRGVAGAAAKDGDNYRTKTAELADTLRRVIQLEPYDPNRPQDVKEAQAQAKAWASNYAPGGSGSLGGSASKMYTVVDAFNGHVAANGAAPVRARLKGYLLNNLDEVDALLQANK